MAKKGEILNIQGQKFGKLTALRVSTKKVKVSATFWECVCECGNTRVVRVDRLRNGENTMCLSCSKIAHPMFKHGMWKTRTFRIYNGAKFRCENQQGASWHKYGARGIKFLWTSFSEFYKEMGDVPKGKTLDRINNDGNYEPGNCRWATPKEQARNRRSNHVICRESECRTLTEWSEITGIHTDTIKKRIDRGLTVEKALTREG